MTPLELCEVPPCTRGGHYCQDLCPEAYGVPCSPLAGRQYDWWQPHAGPGKRYAMLKGALPTGVTLTKTQERYLRWLAGWDDETAAVVASLIATGH